MAGLHCDNGQVAETPPLPQLHILVDAWEGVLLQRSLVAAEPSTAR